MPPKQNEVDKFFEGLPSSQDASKANVFDDPATQPPKAAEPAIPAKDTVPKSNDDDGSEPRKNRRHRRLEEQLEAERRSNIELNKRIVEIATAKASVAPTPTEIPASWIALYGDNEEAKKAWGVQAQMLQSVKEQAKEEALQAIRSEQEKARQEIKQYESFIDGQLENLEDAHDIDLTSDAPAARKARKEFLDLITTLSPKDEDGNIQAYVDFGAAFDIYKQQKAIANPIAPTTDKAKEIAGRSMQQSGQGVVTPEKTITPGFHGWKKDFGLN